MLCCTYACGRQLLSTHGSSLGVTQGWQLVSEQLYVKYSCLLAMPIITALARPNQWLVRGGNVRCSIRAMAAHHSQWVW